LKRRRIVAAPFTVAGNFDQTATGMLDLDFDGEASGQFGALTITALATLDGALRIDLTGDRRRGTWPPWRKVGPNVGLEGLCS
jgi:hypothetical protein